MIHTYSRYYYSLVAFIIMAICFSYFRPFGLDSQFITPLCTVLIMSLGILHGSNDIATIRFLMISQKISFKTKMIFYILSTFIFALLFYIDKSLMLITFVGFSAYHFGEERALAIPGLESVSNLIWSIAYGSFIFLTLFYFNFDEFSEIVFYFGFEQLTRHHIGQLILPFVIIQSIILFGNFVLRKIPLLSLLLVLLEIAAITTLFKFTGLLFGFTAYFILWHSIPSIYTQIKNRTKLDTTFGLFSFILESLPVYSLSIFFAAGTLYSYSISLISIEFVFTLISCTTLPHILVMALTATKKDAHIV